MTDLHITEQAIPRNIITEPPNRQIELFPLPVDESVLQKLLIQLFEQHWQQIRFGVMIPGAVYEIKAPNKPERINHRHGYLTIDFCSWHFHLCIGDYRDSHEDAHVRKTARAEFYRMLNSDAQPTSWGFRMFNGADQQQLVVFMPNPLLTSDDKIAKKPDWSRLALWEQLRDEFLGLQPDSIDRTAPGFIHG
jgi:hypothetical protein